MTHNYKQTKENHILHCKLNISTLGFELSLKSCRTDKGGLTPQVHTVLNIPTGKSFYKNCVFSVVAILKSLALYLRSESPSRSISYALSPIIFVRCITLVGSQGNTGPASLCPFLSLSFIVQLPS